MREKNSILGIVPVGCKHDRILELTEATLVRELDQVPSRSEIREASPSLPDYEFVESERWFVDLEYGTSHKGYVCVECGKFEVNLSDFR